MDEKIHLKRKIYDKLLEWKNNSDGKTALLIEGARRIVKSTIAEEFAKNEYDDYLIIDFNLIEDGDDNGKLCCLNIKIKRI